jgi:cytidylate kinase
MKIYEVLNQPLEEGPNDPHIFKAVFMAGGPGSGKSYAAGKLLGGSGLKTVNSDEIYEYLAYKHDLDLSDPDVVGSEKGQEIRNKAKDLTKKRRNNYLHGRLGVLIDGTGKDVDKVAKDKQALEELGYECIMIMVNTDLDVTLKRNAQRARTVPADMLTKMWNTVQSNVGKFQRVFGSANFHILDNTYGLDHPDVKDDALEVQRSINNFLAAPPRMPAAREWLAAQGKGKA